MSVEIGSFSVVYLSYISIGTITRGYLLYAATA